MAFFTETHSPSVLARVGGFFANLGRAVMMSRAAEARVHRMEALMAKSDAELAEIGLRREDIARHVFRDILYI